MRWPHTNRGAARKVKYDENLAVNMVGQDEDNLKSPSTESRILYHPTSTDYTVLYDAHQLKYHFFPTILNTLSITN